MGGRPRADGERYPCGKLRPPAPNPKVVAERQALLGAGGDLTRASHPLDLALARGWITERHHRAGTRYASLYRRARLGAPDREGQGRIEEMREAETDSGRFSGMTDAAITAAFDRVFDEEGGLDADLDAAGAGAAWRKANAAMTAAEQSEVFLVCVRASWPQWIIQRAAGRYGTRWEDRHALLIRGLEAIAAPARTARPAKESVVARATPPRAAGAGLEDRTSYVTPQGELLFQVVRRVRRRDASAQMQNPASRSAAETH
jgi:hypothetical protein